MTSSVENSGLLLVLMEPPASLEEEFNQWYDTEHLPQRRSLPGFLSGARWTCVAGWPRWAAVYELSSPDVVNSPEYLAVSGKNSTPWSRRVLPRTIGYMRVVATEHPSVEVLDRIGAKTSSSMMIVRYTLSGETPEMNEFLALATANLKHLDPLQTRAFIEKSDAADQRLWLMATFDYPASAADVSKAIGRVGTQGADLLNLYVPYRQ